MGSQPRRTGARRRGRRGRAGGAEGGGESEEETKRREQIYRRARKKIDDALKANNFSYAADVATSLTISQASVRDVVSLLLAGAKAYREGKDRKWEPEPKELAASGIRHAQDKTGYELTMQTRGLFNNILAANLRTIGEKMGRKSS